MQLLAAILLGIGNIDNFMIGGEIIIVFNFIGRNIIAIEIIIQLFLLLAKCQ